MCGLTFYCVNQQLSDLKSQLRLSLQTTAHRGPDASGEYFYQNGQLSVGLGHNRLSIIDLSPAGSQPMFSNTGISLVFNGEVYNHQFLRTMLIEKGYSFSSTSDTEVILKLYQEFQVTAFSMLEGMYTLAILDEPRATAFLVRDSIGVKPIYYYASDKNIYASSEIKGLKAYTGVNLAIDEDDVFEFFNNGFLYEPNTGYYNIKKIRPGHYLEIDLDTGLYNEQAYEYAPPEVPPSDLGGLIQRSVHRQLGADVPVGVFFSGGADSSIIAAYAENSDLFFANYDEGPVASIDTEYSGRIAEFLGKKLVVAKINTVDTDPFESIDFVATHSEELISDYTFWATYKLSMEAQKNGYKVMLSGMGGDEAFAGYPRYKILPHHASLRWAAPLLQLVDKFSLVPKRYDKRFERLISYATESYWPLAYSRLLGYFSKKDLQAFFKGYSNKEVIFKSRLAHVMDQYIGSSEDKIKCAQHLDAIGFLSHNLSVADKASMLASIEMRVPLLDENVVNFGKRTQSSQLLNGGEPKAPLKNLLKALLPSDLVERPKTGFNPPLDGLISQIGEKTMAAQFEYIFKYLRRERVDMLVREHFHGVANNTYKLWQLVYFERWLRANF